jgi:hypothetical protein
MVARSHQPRSRAAVRCEKAAVRGSTSCHAASSSSWVRLSAGAYTPRVTNHLKMGAHGLGVTGYVTSATPVGEEVASYARVTSTEIGPSASTQLMPPVIRPTARKSSSTALRCANDSAEP